MTPLEDAIVALVAERGGPSAALVKALSKMLRAGDPQKKRGTAHGAEVRARLAGDEAVLAALDRLGASREKFVKEAEVALKKARLRSRGKKKGRRR